jgi:hypothetical protein
MFSVTFRPEGSTRSTASITVFGRSNQSSGAVWVCGPPQSRATWLESRPSNSPERATTDVPRTNQAMAAVK